MFIKLWSVDDEVLIILELVLCTSKEKLINLSLKLKFFLLFLKFFHIISYLYIYIYILLVIVLYYTYATVHFCWETLLSKLPPSL